LDVLFSDGVLVKEIVHQNDPDDLSLTPEGDRGKRMNFRILTKMLSNIASYF
jgi:hypothetical protein